MEELRARSTLGGRSSAVPTGRGPGGSSRYLRYLPLTTFVVDALVIATAVIGALLLRSQTHLLEKQTTVSDEVGIFAAVLLLTWLAALALVGTYRPDVFVAGTDEFRRVVRATLLTFGAIGVGCYLTEYPLARGFFVFSLLIGGPAVLIGRFLLRRAVHRAHRNGQLLSRVLIVGSVAHIDEITAVLRRESFLGYEVVGALAPIIQSRRSTAFGVKILGTTHDVLRVADEVSADVVFFAGGSVQSSNDLRTLAWELAREDIQLVVAPAVTEVSSERVRVRPVGGLPLMHVDPPQASNVSRFAKRSFDAAGAALGLLLISPVLLALALWVKVHDGGPVLFRQTRAGKDGVAFECLKFRSMVPNAEDLLAQLHEEHGHEEGLFKLKEDPRITRPGRFIRKYSLDELPQLFNVLRGEMSLVGPRPPLPSEVETYQEHVTRRLDVRPGMTGLWQISGRSDLSWEEAVRLDLYYVDNWSVLQDLNILVKTVKVVLKSEGAY